VQFQELANELVTRAQMGGAFFQLGFVFCESPGALDRLAESLKVQLAAAQPPLPVQIFSAADAPITEAVLQAIENFAGGVLWLAIQRADDAELRAVLTHMNERRSGVVARVPGMLVLAMRDNFSGELGAMVSDLWAIRSFAYTVPIIRDAVEEPLRVSDNATQYQLAASSSLPDKPLSLYEIDRLLQRAEIAARDLYPDAAIALITQACAALQLCPADTKAFAIAERALRLSEHLLCAAQSLELSKLLLSWKKLNPKEEVRITRKLAEALIAVGQAGAALALLDSKPQVLSVDPLACTAQAEALLRLDRNAQAIASFEKVLKYERRDDSAVSTRCRAGLAQAFFNASAFRNAINTLELGIVALERRIVRKGNAPLRALRMAKMLSLEREINRIGERAPRADASPEVILYQAMKQFGPVPTLTEALALLANERPEKTLP
jgi:tetratricopeptide (TPR) repeat protein